MTPLENAECNVTAARGRLRGAALNEPRVPDATIDLAIDGLIRAVEARCAERLRSEGHHTSGQIALGLFQGADLIDPNTQEKP